MNLSRSKRVPYARRALFACLLLSTGSSLPAQTRRPPRVITRQTDIVYSTRFSPDGRTLAIARGAADTARVELWEVATGTLRHTIGGFEGQVWSASFAPDGRTLVTASNEFHPNKLGPQRGWPQGKHAAELKWWDAQTGELKQQVTLPRETPTTITAWHSPNGKMLATVEYQYVFGGSYNADVRLLDAQTGELRFKLKQNLKAFEASLYGSDFRNFDPVHVLLNLRRPRIAWSSNSELLAYWNSDELLLWNSTTGEETLKLKDFKHQLTAAAFSTVGQTLALAITTTSKQDKAMTFVSTIRLYDAMSGEVTKTFPPSDQVISCLAFPNQKQIMAGGWRRPTNGTVATLELLDLQAGSLGILQTGDDGSVNIINVSSNGRSLTFQTDVASVNLVDTQTWSIKHTFDENTESSPDQKSVSRFVLSVRRVLALAFSANGKTLASEIERGGIRLWDPRTGELKNRLGEHDDSAAIVDISNSATTAAEVIDDESIRLWDVGSNEKKILPTLGGPISALALSPDGRTMAIGRANKIVLLSTANREQIRTLAANGSDIKYLAFAADGGTLAAASDGSTIQTWNLASGQITQTMPAGKITALRFAPAGRLLASGTEDGSIYLWDLQSGNLMLQLKKHSGSVNAIAFSPEGNFLASGGDDRTVIIWEIATGKPRHTLKGHDLAVTCLAFSPDGSLLATGAGNSSVVLWDVPTGKLNRVLK